MCHLLGKATFAPDLFKYAELSALPGPTECTEPSVGIEAWYTVCFGIVLCSFVIVCLALKFTCLRTFLESKLWENRYVFGMMVIVVGSLTSSLPHPTLVTVVGSLYPVFSTKPVMAFLCSLPGVGYGMDVAKVGGTSRKCWLLRKTQREDCLFASGHCCVCMWCLGQLRPPCYNLTMKSVLSELWNHPALEPTHFGLFVSLLR